jgi:hypothetical protein
VAHMRSEIESWVSLSSPGCCRGADHAEPQASVLAVYAREVTVARGLQAVDYHAARLRECLNTPNGDVSRVYVVEQEISSISTSEIQCGRVMSTDAK